MGRVRTKTVKRAARLIVEKYFVKLTLDFYINKRIIQEIATIQSNRLTNRITGYTTHLMKRIRSGPARGISFKLQEEERERRDQYVPSKSVFITKKIELDQATANMIDYLKFKDLVQRIDADDKETGDRCGNTHFLPGLETQPISSTPA